MSAAAAAKPGMQEAMTRAVNATNLTEAPHEDQQHSLERLVALGWVAGESLQKRLGVLFIRLDAGDRQRRVEAVGVLAAWLATKREVRDKWHEASGSQMLRRFAAMLLLEWEHSSCDHCGGEGTVPQAPDRANPRGWRKYCDGCDGKGQRRRDQAARAAALEIPFSVYEKRWAVRFEKAHGWLSWVGVERDLRRRLSRDTVPVQQRVVAGQPPRPE